MVTLLSLISTRTYVVFGITVALFCNIVAVCGNIVAFFGNIAAFFGNIVGKTGPCQSPPNLSLVTVILPLELAGLVILARPTSE